MIFTFKDLFFKFLMNSGLLSPHDNYNKTILIDTQKKIFFIILIKK